MQEIQVQFLSLEDPVEKEMTTHSGILAWRIPDRGAWWATVHGVAKNRTRLSTQASCTLFQNLATPQVLESVGSPLEFGRDF